ncbi:MAG: Gfo/Idh/MocA family oxidoreductase [Gammaproteobacteria bacterium]|nr:Gfo/Idh/MocA family oxidoreductase [Gammaproteobacteria bacterium]
MVGGGDGAFIGAVHRSAAALDGRLELVCGAFSSDPERSRRSGAQLLLDPGRCYASYEDMFRREAALPPDRRMEFVAIVTPNHLHWPVARQALARGFHVLSDKPATLSLDECRALRDALRDTGLLYGLTHPYTAYPAIVEARERVAAGELGRVRKVLVEYVQGWLAEPIERAGNPQAEWRLDPARAGLSSCMGDIGVHAFNLAEHVTGERVVALCAVLNRTVDGRQLDDDGAALLRFASGAHGVLSASQVCVGEENDLRLRVYGERGSLDWRQQEPNSLWLRYIDRPAQLVRTAAPGMGPGALAATRVPAGHPEGYIEAFANLYRGFAARVAAFPERADAANGEWLPVPGIDAALRGMAFIEAVVAASASDAKWHAFPDV